MNTTPLGKSAALTQALGEDLAEGRTSHAARAAFSKRATVVLGYTVLVIVFGAVVRITGSGAGCGQHWPTCQGELLHLPNRLETAIELGHRVTSGLSLLLVGLLFFLSLRQFEKADLARRATAFSLVFIVIEALIGALLVLLRLVGDNDSLARAVVMAAHLINTSLLTGSLAVAAWAANQPRHRAVLDFAAIGRGSSTGLALALLLTLLVATTGAVTALGDTLYPAATGSPLIERLSTLSDLSAHFLQRLRVIHPFLAIFVAIYLLVLTARLRLRAAASEVGRWARATALLVWVQTGAGVLNVLLSAPGWLQVVHLTLATLLWISLVLLTLSAAQKSSPLEAHA